MLLIIAFALFALLIVAWIAMPAVSANSKSAEPVSAGLPAMGSHSA